MGYDLFVKMFIEREFLMDFIAFISICVKWIKLLSHETLQIFYSPIHSNIGSSSTHEQSLPDVEDRVRENLTVDINDGNFRFSVWISFAEIYNEQIYDLLVPISKKNAKRPTLKISDDKSGSPYIKGIYNIVLNCI